MTYIPHDAPFVPDEPAERLRPNGSRDISDLVRPILDERGQVVGYDIAF